MNLILLPGLDGTSDLFASILSEFPNDIHVSALCYPTDVCLDEGQFSRMIGLWAETDAPFLLVAESFSTPIAIQYAARFPEHVLGLVLVAGFAKSPLTGWRRIAASMFAGALFRLPLPEIVVRTVLVGKDASQSLVDSVRAAVRRVAPAVLADRLRLVLNCDVRADLARVSVPVLYVRAENDRLVSEEAMREVLRCQPKTEVVRIPGPHLLAQCEPERVADSIIRFLKEASSKRR